MCAIFDEAHYSSDNRPSYATKLMELAEEHLAVTTTPNPTPAFPTQLIPSDDAPPYIPPAADDAPIITTSPAPSSLSPPTAQIHSPTVTTDAPSATLPHLPHYIPDDNSCTATINAATGPPDDFHLTSNPFGPSTTVALTTKETQPTLSLDLYHHSDTSRIVLRLCFPSTPAARIPRWRSTLQDS